jgi:hypothetical protein
MNAVATFKHNEAISKGIEITRDFKRFIKTDWLIGFDPVRRGLHPFEDTNDGRLYCNTPHVAYGFHQHTMPVGYRLTTTVIVGESVTPKVVVHEIGHVLDESLGFSILCTPCTGYARTNRLEAFAEAFTAFLVPGYAEIHPEDYLKFQAIIQGGVCV